MSNFIALAICRSDGRFTCKPSRHQFIRPLIQNQGFLAGDGGSFERLFPAEENGHWRNLPSEDGYVLIDEGAGEVLTWTSNPRLDHIDGSLLAPVHGAPANVRRLREGLRPYLVTGSYFKDDFGDLVRREFGPLPTEADLKRVMSELLREGRPVGFLGRPYTTNRVTYELKSPAWRFKALDIYGPRSLSALRAEVEKRPEMSEADNEAWDDLLAGRKPRTIMDTFSEVRAAIGIAPGRI